MSKQHVLVELKQFIQAVTARKRLTSNALIRTSLRLLEDLPAAREIIFDYFSIVGEIAVQSYVSTTNIDQQTGLPVQQARGNINSLTADVSDEDTCFTPIQEALETLICKGPPNWTSYIASWGLNLVGNLSDKYTKRKTSIAANCNFWLNCEAMRGLLTLISLSFRKLNNAEAETCVLTLLSVFQRCPLTFDWAVARLGGCFPQKIISQILHCSLKRFAEDFHCHFDSEIGILDYLSFAHEQELKLALRELLQEGFEPKRGLDASIIPFLMVLSNYSDVLLQNMAIVFLNMYNDDLRAVIIRMTPLWMSNKMFLEMQPSLNSVALRLNSQGIELLIAVAKMADEYNWCQDFLEYTLQEFEQVILNAGSCPLLADLQREETKYMLWRSCLSANVHEQQTAVRLLLIVATLHSHIYYQTISELLRKSYALNKNGIGAVIRMIGGQAGVVDFPDIKPGLQMVFEDVLLQEQFQRSRLVASSQDAYNTFMNLNTLTRMQAKNMLPYAKHQLLVNVLQDCLPKILQILDVTLNKLVLQLEEETMKAAPTSSNINNGDDDKCLIQTKIARTAVSGLQRSMSSDEINREEEHKHRLKLANTIIDLLNTIDAGSKSNIIRTTEVLKLSLLSVKYFFVSLSHPDSISRSRAIERVFALLRRQCTARKSARTACLRELVEGSLFYYGYLFGQSEEPYVDPLEIPEHEMVLMQNQRNTVGVNANRTVLHAGVIGRGVRQSDDSGMNSMNNCDQELQHLFLKALDCCCFDTDKQNIIEGYSMISLLLVELVSTDVMYNGLPFPDEEFTKVTMERDLMIRRAFNNSPILWALLGFISTHRPALCFSSVLLRALCATCLHQWRARNVHKFQAPQLNDQLLLCTKKLLRVLALGQLLPPPLSNLHVIIEHFEPLEIALLLKECVWNYMKDHVPSPALFQIDSNGLHWRNPHTSKVPAKYIDTLRSLMQKKLTTLGAHYHQMFVMVDDAPATNIDLTNETPTKITLPEVDCTNN